MRLWAIEGFSIALIFTISGLSACTLGNIRSKSTDALLMTRDRCEADPNFVFIPAAAFVSGSDRAERDYAYRISAEAAAGSPDKVAQAEQRLRQRRWFDGEPERRQHPSEQSRSDRKQEAEAAIALPAFCLGRNLVTNAEYQAFIQATGHPPPGISAADYQEQGFLVHPYKDVKPFLWQGDRYPAQEGQHPVVLVSYEDAIAFAQWKGKQDGTTYRLPTALEWEKAARGTDGRYFPWGNEWRNEATNWADSGLWHTSPIAAFPLSHSPYGVEDMAGNVFEFTSTLVKRRDRTRAVMKGCSWDDLPGFCRAAYRHTRPIESRHILFGFRLVRQ